LHSCKFYTSLLKSNYFQLFTSIIFRKFLKVFIILQYNDYHDIIIYFLINKELLFRKFFYQLTSISFYLLNCHTYSLVFYRSLLTFSFSSLKFLNNISSICLIKEDTAITIIFNNNNKDKNSKKQDKKRSF